MTLPDVPPEFDKLSTEEKIKYVQKLWERIAEDPAAVELTEEQRVELDRRLQRHGEDLENTSTWAEVKARLQGNK